MPEHLPAIIAAFTVEMAATTPALNDADASPSASYQVAGERVDIDALTRNKGVKP